MAKSLFESYKNRLAVANTVYSRAHNGENMSNHKKLVTAKNLENINRFMNEAFDNSVGTQRADMDMFKKFALNLTTVAMPNLVAHDLVIVHPMSSMSGFITYIEYKFASNKGGVTKEDLIANPFQLGQMTDERVNFTAARVVETAKGTEFTPAWGPVVKDEAGKQFVEVEGEGGVWTPVELVDGKATVTDGARVRYVYNNVVIPQNDLPMIRAEMKAISLVAKARRIAIYYSQIAAYQAKTDYGVDLGDQLAEKAVGELSYEIDTEIIDLLSNMASKNDKVGALLDDGTGAKYLEELEWSKTLPVGVSKAEHYDGFAEIVEIAKQKIYDATQKFAPNYMIIASDVLPVLALCKTFKAAPTGAVNGPYVAGTFGSLKVVVSPRLKNGRYVIGCNGSDMMSSAAVYAPYMAVVPTQLLGYADGGMSQGWSTLYDLKELNPLLVVAGRVTK